MKHKHGRKPRTKEELEHVPLVEMTDDEQRMAMFSDIDAGLIADARSKTDQEFHIAAVVLVRSGQPDSIVYYVDEQGDGEGERMARETAENIINFKLLLPGEGVRTQTYRFTLPEAK